MEGSNIYKMAGRVFRKIGVLPFVIIAMSLFIQCFNSNFFTVQNLMNVMRQSSILSVVAFGMTLVIICGCVDFSVGSVMGLSSVIGCTIMLETRNVVLGFAVSLVIGLMCGIFTGAIVAYSGIHPFIVTLGTLSIFSGLAFIYTNGQLIFGMPQSFINLNAGSFFGVIPYMICIPIICFFILRFVLYKTTFGYYLYEIGGREEAAAAAGINVKWCKIGAYAISGIAAAISGLLITTRIVAGQASVGQNYHLMAIGTAIIGGTSLTGGKGTLGGTVQGLLIIGILSNGLNLLKVGSFWQDVATGATIVIAVLMDAYNQKKAHKKGGIKSAA